MRIVHVIEAFGGGTLNAVVLLANQQAADGHEVVVVHSRRADTPPDAESLFRPGVRLVSLAMPQELSPRADLTAGRALRRCVLALQPTLVHLHSSKAGALGRLALVGADFPVVYSPHGFSFNRQDVSGLKRGLFRGIEWALGYLSGHVMACSTDEAQAARWLSPTRRIFNAVDVAYLQAQAAAGTPAITRQGKTLTVAMAGRITAARNPEGFSAMASFVKAERLKAALPPVRFVWLGDGERNLVGPDVTVTGWLSKADLLASLRETDVYFHPSRWDGLPFAVLEAMALGLPVVASTAGGNKDAVEPGRTGYLADAPDDQYSALRVLLEVESVRQSMGAAGQARVQAHFSLTHYFAEVYRYYADLLQLYPAAAAEVAHV